MRYGRQEGTVHQEGSYHSFKYQNTDIKTVLKFMYIFSVALQVLEMRTAVILKMWQLCFQCIPPNQYPSHIFSLVVCILEQMLLLTQYMELKGEL